MSVVVRCCTNSYNFQSLLWLRILFCNGLDPVPFSDSQKSSQHRRYRNSFLSSTWIGWLAGGSVSFDISPSHTVNPGLNGLLSSLKFQVCSSQHWWKPFLCDVPPWLASADPRARDFFMQTTQVAGPPCHSFELGEAWNSFLDRLPSDLSSHFRLGEGVCILCMSWNQQLARC